ncbi:hypothetical protein Cgig2_019248 [Carnegiea gigantea]|uniref:NnrU domain-containing protein n=1 Tax=Carnegiea gigantea TaxID=171969 RepID=A0A9Q1GUB0_9CARY|nr:hypothetical protein Cgig2_019248 [Carnegiea gigantea]
MASSLLLSTPFTCSPPRHYPKPLTLTAKSPFSPSYHSIPHKFAFQPAISSNIVQLSVKPFQFRRKLLAGTSVGDSDDDSDDFLVGEDSAAFDLSSQKISSWVYFTVILGIVLFALNLLWIDNSSGFGKYYISALENIFQSPELVMLSLTIIFAAVHSGLASFRDTGEKLIGERAFRVLFAGISLPLAVSTVVYFINHRHDGAQLWQLQSVPGVHQLVWLSSLISFLFLYPSTFNLLEVAAVDKPKLHLWETGIMRITRHPQSILRFLCYSGLFFFIVSLTSLNVSYCGGADNSILLKMVGQVIWCLAHTVWIGNSVAVAASIGLIGHHLFGVWNGDRRLALRYGDAFETVKNRTSIIPFAAIIDGRQQLPKSYYREFIRLPYLAVIAVTLGAYFAHPLMQSASFGLHW